MLRFLFVLGWAWAAVAAHAQVLRVAVPELPATLDPHSAATPIERALAREIFEGLVTIDAFGRPAPGLAERWTIESGGTRYLFKLRPGVNWSDGRRITAEDVVEGLKRALDPATRAPLSALLLPIRSAAEFQLGTVTAGTPLGVVARSETEVEITLSAPSVRVLQVLSSPLAAPVPRHKMAQLGEAWAAPFLAVTNGAYAPTPMGDRYALKRNDRYRGEVAASADRIEFAVVSSHDAAVEAVANDRADLAMGFAPEPAFSPAPQLRAEAGLLTFNWIVNAARPPFDRRDVRHALAMALDREGFLAEAKLDGATAAFSLTPQAAIEGYDPPVAPYGKLEPADRIAIAEVLLLDVDRTKPLPIVLAIPEGRLHQSLAASAASAWRELGFTTQIDVRAAADHTRAVLEGAFDVALGLEIDRDADPWAAMLPFSRAAGALNVARYGELEFDERLIPADLETNPEYRLGNLRGAEDVLAEDQVVWPLFVFTPSTPVSPRISGWQPNSTGLHSLRFMSIK